MRRRMRRRRRRRKKRKEEMKGGGKKEGEMSVPRGFSIFCVRNSPGEILSSILEMDFFFVFSFRAFAGLLFLDASSHPNVGCLLISFF